MYEWSVVSVIYEYLHNVNSRRYHWHNRGIIEEKCKAVGVYLVRNLLMMMYRISFNVCRTPYFDETTICHSEISCVEKFCSSFDTFSVNEKLEIKENSSTFVLELTRNIHLRIIPRTATLHITSLIRKFVNIWFLFLLE